MLQLNITSDLEPIIFSLESQPQQSSLCIWVWKYITGTLEFERVNTKMISWKASNPVHLGTNK